MDGHRTIPAATPALLLALAIACSDSGAPGPAGPGGRETDRTAPATVTDARLSYPSPGGDATLSWTAPADDGGDRVDRYEIRYAYGSALVWETSLPVVDPPAPAEPGEVQRYTFGAPERGRDLRAAVRSFDRAGNASPVGPDAHVRVTGYTVSGEGYDPLTGRTVEGLAVTATESRVHNLSTGPSGDYRLDDVAGDVFHVSLRSGDAAASYHDYDLTVRLAQDVHLRHPVVEYRAAENPLGENILRLCKQAAYPTARDGRIRKWRAYPIDVYVLPLVNEAGVDYGDFGKRAVQRWNERTGLAVFNLVDTPPADGIEIAFKTRDEIAPQNGFAHIEPDGDGYPVNGYIHIVDDLGESKLWSILLHELGHTIPLGHLPGGYLMYAGQPLPADITADEVALVRLYLALPNDLDLEVYDTAPPRP